MNSTRKGDGLERRFTAIMQKLGYTMAAKATRSPVFVPGVGLVTRSRVVAGGPTDLLDGSIDRIYVKPGVRVVFAQITTTNGVSERRQKLRGIRHKIPPEHVELVLAGWDRACNSFRLYRDDLGEDFLEKGWRLATGDSDWPWDRPTRPTQERLDL